MKGLHTLCWCLRCILRWFHSDRASCPRVQLPTHCLCSSYAYHLISIISILNGRLFRTWDPLSVCIDVPQLGYFFPPFWWNFRLKVWMSTPCSKQNPRIEGPTVCMTVSPSCLNSCWCTYKVSSMVLHGFEYMDRHLVGKVAQSHRVWVFLTCF